MALNLAQVAKEEPKRTKIPRLGDGTYFGRVASVVDFGIQKQTDWKTGKETEPKPTVMITFQVPDESIEVEDEESGETKVLPRYIGKEYNLSTFERSNLMKMIAAIAPQIESLEELINLPAMLQVGSTKSDNAKITAVMAPPKGMEVAELTVDTAYFDFTFPEKELFDKLPQWQQERITSAINWNAPEGWDDADADSKY